MNKSNINVPSAGTEVDSNSTAQNQHVSQPNANTNVVGSLFVQREIKFRAWGKFGDWDEETDEREWLMVDGDSLAFEEYLPICQLLQSEENEVYYMQFTGLKDKNGKEIYEGDIVKWGHIKGGEENPVRIALVVWKNDIQFHILNYKMDFAGQNKVFHFGSFIYSNTEKWMEVLGNCFENPELLHSVA